MATVTECKYDIGAGRAMAFGLPTSKRFRIRFNYWATDTAGESSLHTGELRSATAMEQGHLFPVRYNPATPHLHEHSGATVPPLSQRKAVLIVGILGSAVLSLAWLFILRGCR